MLRFRMKAGMGKHYLGKGQVVRPGDIIEMHCLEELGAAAFKFEQLDPDPEPEPSRDGLTVAAAGDGLWNVINPGTGDPINDVPLSASDAAALAGVPVESFCDPDGTQPPDYGSEPQGDVSPSPAGHRLTDADEQARETDD